MFVHTGNLSRLTYECLHLDTSYTLTSQALSYERFVRWEICTSLSWDKRNWILFSCNVRTEHWIQTKDIDTAYSFSCILKENSTANPANFDKEVMKKKVYMFDYRLISIINLEVSYILSVSTPNVIIFTKPSKWYEQEDLLSKVQASYLAFISTNLLTARGTSKRIAIPIKNKQINHSGVIFPDFNAVICLEDLFHLCSRTFVISHFQIIFCFGINVFGLFFFMILNCNDLTHHSFWKVHLLSPACNVLTETLLTLTVLK